jgi:transcriptional repressor NrdR
MHCPFCQHEDTRVIDSRVSDDGTTIRRRRETFDEGKLRTGFMRALQKRPVGSEQVDAAVRVVVEELRRSGEREIPSLRVGELVMRELKKLDHVAYVRFASVYRSFEDVQAFREEIERLERDLPSIEGLQLSLLGEPTPVGSRKATTESAMAEGRAKSKALPEK